MRWLTNHWLGEVLGLSAHQAERFSSGNIVAVNFFSQDLSFLAPVLMAPRNGAAPLFDY
jgi:hypothetical protein